MTERPAEKECPNHLWASRSLLGGWAADEFERANAVPYVPAAKLNDAVAIIERKDREISALNQKLITKEAKLREALDNYNDLAGKHADVTAKLAAETAASEKNYKAAESWQEIALEFQDKLCRRGNDWGAGSSAQED